MHFSLANFPVLRKVANGSSRKGREMVDKELHFIIMLVSFRRNNLKLLGYDEISVEKCLTNLYYVNHYFIGFYVIF